MAANEFGWMMRRAASCAALLAAGSAAWAQQDGRVGDQATALDQAVELYISDDALQVQYVRTMDFGEFGPTQVRGGFFYNEDRDLIGVVDGLVSVGDDIDVRRLEVRVGPRLYAAFLAPEDQDVFGIGVGGEAQYFFGSARSTSVTLGLFYSPDIVTFGTADNIKDANLRLMTRLRNGTDIFLGFRAFEIDLPVDREVDDNLHVGLRRSF